MSPGGFALDVPSLSTTRLILGRYVRTFENPGKLERSLAAGAEFAAFGTFRTAEVIAVEYATNRVEWRRLTGARVHAHELTADCCRSIARGLRELHRATEQPASGWGKHARQRVESLREFESGTPQERWGLAALREFTRSEAGFPATLSLCHRDFAPYNLLRDRRYRGSRQWGVLDFEHARVDAPLVDVARALLTFGPARGDFLRAYQPGVAETQTAERVLPYLLLDLLQTLRWSKRHADAPREVSALNDLEQIVDCGAEVWIFG